MKNTVVSIGSILLLLLAFSGCGKNNLQNIKKPTPIEPSIGMNGDVFKAKEVAPNQATKEKFGYVTLALEWLANHQEEDGHWDTGKYEGKGDLDTNIATTAAALLGFLNSGYSSKYGKWKHTVKKTIEWLIKEQKPNGSFSKNNYVNGICTYALAEAAGMSGNSEECKVANLATIYLLSQQNTSGGFSYEGPIANSKPNYHDDISVTVWCVMAMKSAQMAGIKTKEIKKAFKKLNNLLDNANYTKDNTTTTKGESWYRAVGAQGSGVAGGSCQTVTMVVRQYLGWERSAPWLNAAADAQIKNIPKEYRGMNVYQVYFCYSALFQQGGQPFRAYQQPILNILNESQRLDGDFKGSWDPTGCSLDVGGRVLYTALLCTITTFYCYDKN